MKKSILMLGVIFLINQESKAQELSQYVAFNNAGTVTPVAFPLPAYGKPDKDADFYNRRSKNYRIVGWSTLGGGIVLSGIGLLLANGDYATNNANSNTAGIVTLAGAVSGVVSIPFMIMASAYKHKAKAMLGSQKTGFGVPANVSKDIVGITFQIPLGK
ncbi:MAG: hypothetical protein ACKOU7_06340 [Ferruginibacter sp.]